MHIKVDMKTTPGRLSLIARSRSANVVGEVYVRGAENVAHAKALADLGHNPLEVTRIVRDAARITIRSGVTTFDPAKERAAFERAAKYTAYWCRNRIATGMLGTMKPSTIRRKIWAISRGRASAKFGNPGPYGFYRGNLYHNINGRVRDIRGSH